MNPSSTQKDNDLISTNNLKRNHKKLPTDSDEENPNPEKNNNEKFNEKDDHLPYANNQSPPKKNIHLILDSNILSEENKPNQNLGMSNVNNLSSVDENISNIKNVMDQAKKLQVKIAVSSILPKGQILEIDPLGLVGSIRENHGDGYTFFGFLTEEELKNNKSIDFLIKPKEENFENRFKGKHFQIRFNYSDLKYYICDLGNGFGTFAKLTGEIVIKDNYLINLGNSYIVLIYDDDIMNADNKNSSENTNNNSCTGINNLKNEKILILKIFSGNEKFDPIKCSPIKKKLTIGRDEDCDVVMEDSLLSRYHCTVIYREDLGWCILDGLITETGEIKKSTNGTWLYLMEETEITNGMVFKGNQNVFKCNYID